ncbi:MAG: TIGR02677 family protein [Acidimicrobiaceae bacterium]|nr:TIGR02677 family protein [Acidimicrobiaceae bacterium]
MSDTAADPVEPLPGGAAHGDLGGDVYESLGPDDRARLLFRYLGGEEWAEYRAILAVFADTYFSDFGPAEVHAQIRDADLAERLSPDTVHDRLESLRRWGNLEASTDIGRPSSIDDYYRRRHRYLITPAGQQVFDLVERVLASADKVADPQAGRLGDLHRGLQLLADHASGNFRDLAAADATAAVRAVFDTHERFVDEITGFFRQLAQWQSRYDLSPEEVQLLAGVIVGYVDERLNEIERMRGPIERCLEAIMPRLDALLASIDTGLAGRVSDAGLADEFDVRRARGSDTEHWQHLGGWFTDAPGRPARLTQLTEQALAAVRTLTANLSRLSRLGALTTSRRADFLRLAAFVDAAPHSSRAHDVFSAALGLGSCRHAGLLAADADDPAPTTTAWSDAPRAVVPVSLRERGDVVQRGRPTPMRDRREAQQLMRERLERERVEQEAVAAELLSSADATGDLDGAELSAGAFALLRDLIGTAGHQAPDATGARVAHAWGLRCELRRMHRRSTVVRCPQGRMTMHGITVAIVDADAAIGIRSAVALSPPSPLPAARQVSAA